MADLVFRLYDRPVHPEWFQTLSRRRVVRDGATIEVRITPTGHVLEWTRGDSHLTEVTSALGHPLPDAGRRLALRFASSRRGQSDLPGVRYEVELQVETLPPEVFLHVHEELTADAARRGLVHHFRPHNRLGLAPLGFLTVEALPSGLAVAAFHTFPEEFAVIKTQSLVEPL